MATELTFQGPWPITTFEYPAGGTVYKIGEVVPKLTEKEAEHHRKFAGLMFGKKDVAESGSNQPDNQTIPTPEQTQAGTEKPAPSNKK